jgi:DNA-binding NtrC family response regulator/tetratricopeptide (TPR) repeat protein
VLPDERRRLEHLEHRLTSATAAGSGRSTDLETLADLYFQSDHYEPALETIERLLASPEAGALSPARRLALELKRSAILRRQGRFLEAWDAVGPAVESDDAGLPRATRAALAIEGAIVLCHLARYDEALVVAHRAQAHADAAGDRTLAARAAGQAGFVHLRRGDMLLARESYEEALALFRRLGDDTNVAWARHNLGIVCKNLCEWDSARAHFTEAIAIHRRLGQFAQLGMRLHNLAVLQIKSGAWVAARVALEESGSTFVQVGNSWGLAIHDLARGWLERLEGRYDEAERALGAALERSLAEGFQREEALAREFLGDVAFERDQLDRAYDLYRAALAQGERLAPAGDIVSEVLRRIAEVEVRRGNLAAAETAIERATHVCALLDDRYETAVLQRVRGQLHMARSQHEEARQALRAASNLFGEMGERYERGRAFLLLAQVTPETAEARKLLYRSSACFAEVGSERMLLRVERELARFGRDAAAPAPASPGIGREHGDRGGARVRGRKLTSPELVGPSRTFRRTLDLVGRAAATDLSVILLGETGTGKELLARAIHDQSDRAERPFLAVNCGALRAELALSQLFGHRKGAFTGAHADGVGFVEAAHTGTLFLDEIGELPADVQVTLLRFLESGEYLRLGETQVRRADVRIVGATHIDLRRAVADKRFRADLFYRVHEIEIAVAPLRERPEDVLVLARHFLRAYGANSTLDFDASAAELLLAHPWPGNVRELENTIRRSLALLPASDEPLTAAAIAPFMAGVAAAPASLEAFEEETSGSVAESDRRELLGALDEARGNKSRAAEKLGISRKTLYARMRRLGLEVE